MAAARKSAISIHSERTSGPCCESASRFGQRHGDAAQDRGLRAKKAANGGRLIGRRPRGLQPLRDAVEHLGLVLLHFGIDAPRHYPDLVLASLGVEIGVRHHRYRGGDRARGAGDQHGFLIGGGRGDAEHQTEDGDGAVLHAEDHLAGGGLQRGSHSLPQRRFAHDVAFKNRVGKGA